MKKLRITVGDKTFDVTVEVLSDDHPHPAQRAAHPGGAPPPPAVANDPEAAGAGAVVSPMAGAVKSVLVNEGDAVKRGQALLVLDAMKMENKINAPSDGVVKGVQVKAGDSVQEGQALIVLG